MLAPPHTREVLGIPVSVIDYEGAMDVMDAMIAQREPGWICVMPVHSLIVGQDDPGMRHALVESTLTVPDGMPVVWAANALGESLKDRVYGPTLMDRHCARSAAAGTRVWLYGGRDEAALTKLREVLEAKHPGLQIVGGFSPPFREMTPEDDAEIASRINADRPDIVWVGVGVPKQEKWMVRMRPLLEAPVLVGVGAAFDFHAGLVPQAPPWMQKRGLEWVFRMLQEPRRLVPRYLVTNPRFVWGVGRQLMRERRRG